MRVLFKRDLLTGTISSVIRVTKGFTSVIRVP